MKIYWLQRKDRVVYDEAAGFVVVAASSREARELAGTQSGDEGPTAWMDSSTSSCREVGTTNFKTSMVLVRDFQAG